MNPVESYTYPQVNNHAIRAFYEIFCSKIRHYQINDEKFIRAHIYGLKGSNPLYHNEVYYLACLTGDSIMSDYGVEYSQSLKEQKAQAEVIFRKMIIRGETLFHIMESGVYSSGK